MHVTPLQPLMTSPTVAARHATDPTLEGAMLRSIKENEEILSSAAVELIAASDSPQDAPGRHVDEYA